ncbi:MAG: glycosyl hydrolase family 28-related protein, partial [Pyrinomonadaceae bacterium]
ATASTLSETTHATNYTSADNATSAPSYQQQAYDPLAGGNTSIQRASTSATTRAASTAQADYVPPDAGVVNVKNFGAKGDGVIDDTVAINNAIKSVDRATIYFPNGTYLVSNRLETRQPNGSFFAFKSFLGQSRDGAIIKLKNNASGYGNSGSPKAVLFTTGAGWTGLSSYPTLGTGNDAFMNNVINMTINTGTGNLGAIGIDFLASNQGSVENVRIVSGDGQGSAGLYMGRAWPGPLMISKLTVEGFNYGIHVENVFYHMTLENITLKNQKIAGVYNNNNALAVRDLVSTNNVPAVRNTGAYAHVVLLDSTLSGGSSGVSAIENSSGAQLFARNIVTSGYRSAITNQGSIVPGNSVTEYVSRANTTRFPSPAQSMNLPILETPEYTNSNPADWANVVSYGATPGPDVNTAAGGYDSAAIQAAIDSGKPVVYLPRGRYDLNSTIKLRGNVRKIIGFGAILAGSVSGPGVRTENLKSDFVIIEGLRIRYGASVSVEHASPTMLVMKRLLDSASLRTIAGAGPAFMQDTCCGKNTINGTKLYARQLNIEGAPGSSVYFTNNGGEVWILGYKTDRASPLFDTKS